MKEATGELNGTVVVVIIVGAVIAFFFYVLWPMISEGVSNTSDCSKAVCTNEVQNGKVRCNNNGTEIWCPYKG